MALAVAKQGGTTELLRPSDEAALSLSAERKAGMDYWQGVASRLSVPGITLMVMGALLSFEAPKLCTLVSKKEGERAIAPMKVAGLLLAVLGALILLDVIPI
jgi:hypothetical protein